MLTIAPSSLRMAQGEMGKELLQSISLPIEGATRVLIYPSSRESNNRQLGIINPRNGLMDKTRQQLLHS